MQCNNLWPVGSLGVDTSRAPNREHNRKLYACMHQRAIPNLVVVRTSSCLFRDNVTDAWNAGEPRAHLPTAAAIRLVVGHGNPSFGCKQRSPLHILARGWGGGREHPRL